MTNYRLMAGALALALLGATPAAAADTAAMNSKALLLKPFTLTRLSDLDFGTLIPSGKPEFVQISADNGARTMSNPAMRVATDEGFRAQFGSSGLLNALVVLELDGPADLVNADGDLLKVTRLVLDQNNKVIRALTPSSQVFFVGVGGEIYIRGDQEEGEYVGTFNLTATYI